MPSLVYVRNGLASLAFRFLVDWWSQGFALIWVAVAGESALILIRHGESLWNSKNLFTGCVDVPLSQTGVEEAIEAGKRISELPVDLIYTSALIRAQMTAMLAMTQHHRQKVSPAFPVFFPNLVISASRQGDQLLVSSF